MIKIQVLSYTDCIGEKSKCGVIEKLVRFHTAKLYFRVVKMNTAQDQLSGVCKRELLEHCFVNSFGIYRDKHFAKLERLPEYLRDTVDWFMGLVLRAFGRSSFYRNQFLFIKRFQFCSVLTCAKQDFSPLKHLFICAMKYLHQHSGLQGSEALFISLTNLIHSLSV